MIGNGGGVIGLLLGVLQGRLDCKGVSVLNVRDGLTAEVGDVA